MRTPTLKLLGADREVALQKDREAGRIPECGLVDQPTSPCGQSPIGTGAGEGWQSVAMQWGGGREYKIHVSPEPFVGWNDLFPPWKEITSKIPNGVDAVSSPGKDYVVVMTPRDILIFRIDSKKARQALGKFPLWVHSDDPNETEHAIVMSEWALGRNGDPWEQGVMRQKEPRNSDQP